MGSQDEASKQPSSRSSFQREKHCHRVVTLQNAFKSFLSQTVEAMRAILDDLNMDDHFSIIDFNHNVRCWCEDLVPASPMRVADAKQYIQNIKPVGGPTELKENKNKKQ